MLFEEEEVDENSSSYITWPTCSTPLSVEETEVDLLTDSDRPVAFAWWARLAPVWWCTIPYHQPLYGIVRYIHSRGCWEELQLEDFTGK